MANDYPPSPDKPIIVQIPPPQSPDGPVPLQPQEPIRRSHIPALDAIRGLAILLVTGGRFFTHDHAETWPQRVLFKLSSLGEHGVDLFFVLSGFLITGILFDAKEHDRGYFRDFYVRRTLRIFPLYYGVLLFTFVLLPWLSPTRLSTYAHIEEQQAWLWLYGTNIYQACQKSWALGSFNHFWSLAVEEHFYLVWPLVIFLCSRTQAMWLCLACVGVAVACRLGFLILANNSVAAETLTCCRMDALAIGSWVALAARGTSGLHGLARGAAWSMFLGVGVILGLAVVNALVTRLSDRILTLRTTAYGFLFGGMIVSAVLAVPAGLAGQLWNSRVLRFFGKYSYGIYVFQVPLVPLIDLIASPEYLAAQLGSRLAARAAYTLLAISITVVVALVSWHAFEKHFLKLKDVLAGSKRDLVGSR